MGYISLYSSKYLSKINEHYIRIRNDVPVEPVTEFYQLFDYVSSGTFDIAAILIRIAMGVYEVDGIDLSINPVRETAVRLYDDRKALWLLRLAFFGGYYEDFTNDPVVLKHYRNMPEIDVNKNVVTFATYMYYSITEVITDTESELYRVYLNAMVYNFIRAISESTNVTDEKIFSSCIGCIENHLIDMCEEGVEYEYTEDMYTAITELKRIYKKLYNKRI